MNPARNLEYEVRVSPRARRLSLRVEPGRGVIVTIPRGVSRNEVPGFVARHRGWLDDRLKDSERQTPERFRQWPPQQLPLPAIDMSVIVETAVAGNTVEQHKPQHSGTLPRQIVHRLQCDSEDRQAVAHELARVLKALAAEYLPVRLQMLAEQHQLQYKRVQIRGQRTRWGSCSSRGTISLNFKLLFLSPELVDYVLRHELAHTRHLNHSAAFWRQLLGMQADARELDARLTHSMAQVPPWFNLVSG